MKQVSLKFCTTEKNLLLQPIYSFIAECSLVTDFTYDSCTSWEIKTFLLSSKQTKNPGFQDRAQALIVNLVTSTQRVSGRLSISQSSVVCYIHDRNKIPGVSYYQNIAKLLTPSSKTDKWLLDWGGATLWTLRYASTHVSSCEHDHMVRYMCMYLCLYLYRVGHVGMSECMYLWTWCMLVVI